MSYNLVDSTTGDLTRVAGGIIYANNPIGSIIPFSSSTIPSGYLLCNGQEVSRTVYSELFAAIGTAFGVGDGTTTFNVPDLRECVMVGAGQSTRAILDKSGHSHDVYALGEFKDDQFQGHWHSSPDLTDYYVDWNSKRFGPGQFGTAISNPVTNPISDGRNGTPRTGPTTHGKQIGVNYIIKAKHIGIPAGFIDAIDKAVEGVYGDIIPSDANASNKLVTNSQLLATESMLPEYKTMTTGDVNELRSFADGKLYSLKVSTAFNVVDDNETNYQIPASAEATFFKHAGDLTVQFHSYYGEAGIWEVFYNSNGQTHGKKIV